MLNQENYTDILHILIQIGCLTCLSLLEHGRQSKQQKMLWRKSLFVAMLVKNLQTALLDFE